MPVKTEEEAQRFDPNRTSFSAQTKMWDYIPHPQGANGLLKVDRVTKQIQGLAGVAFPIAIPEYCRNVPQPNVFTCSMPTANNRGCSSCNGCPIFERWPQNQPCNVIVMKDGRYEDIPCFAAYVGTTPAGRPTSQAHYVADGWEVVTDRTFVERNVVETYVQDGVKKSREVPKKMEIPNLAPFYDHLKNPEPPKRKRGRPRKDANREGLPTP
jgi:hypothetical protein